MRREDRPAHDALVRASRQQHPGDVHPDIDGIDLVHPVRIPAAGIAFGEILDAGFAQVAVHAGREPCGQQERFVVRVGEVFFAEFVLGAQDETQHEVGADIAAFLAEQLRRAARCKNDRQHGDAEVVLGVGVTVTVAEAGPVIGLDVGNAVLGAAYFGLVERLGRLGFGRRGRLGRRAVAGAAGQCQNQAE